MRKLNSLKLLLVLCFLLSMAFNASALDDWNLQKVKTQGYSLSSSMLIIDLAFTASLGLTQALIPLDLDSQRFFPDEVNHLDRAMRDRLHTKSDNFLDGTMGSFYPLLLTGAVITGLNLVEGNSSKRTGEEFFMFANGALANGFLTRCFKHTFSRRRPLVEFSDIAELSTLDARPSNHESFYSGHTSTAFFYTAFLRRRISQSLEQHGHAGIKSGYQWLTGITLYSWASYVGYSRIQIDKHYFTDVATGMAMGLLFEEIYYRFNKEFWHFLPSSRLTTYAGLGTFQIRFEKGFS